MNWLDLILVVPLAWFIYKGFKKGLVFELCSLLGLFLGTYVAVHFSSFVAELIGIDGSSAMLVAFFVTFVGVVVLSFFAGKFADGVLKVMKLDVLNKLLGALFGMVKCVCILSVFLYYATLVDFKDAVITHSVKEHSMLYKPVEHTGNLIIGGVKQYVATHKAVE